MILFTQSTVVLRKYLIALKFYLLSYFPAVAQNSNNNKHIITDTLRDDNQCTVSD